MCEATKWRAKPSVIYTKLDDGEGVLLCLAERSFFGLNETGCLIWECIEKGTAERQIAQALEEEYEVGADEAAAAVTEFAATLAADGLVERAEDE